MYSHVREQQKYDSTVTKNIVLQSMAQRDMTKMWQSQVRSDLVIEVGTL